MSQPKQTIAEGIDNVYVTDAYGVKNEFIGTRSGKTGRDATVSPAEEVAARLTATACDGFDCVVGNLVTGAGWLGHSVKDELNGVLSLEPGRTPDWNLEAASARQVEALRTCQGLTLTTARGLETPVKGQVAVAVGDGGNMPWSPYFGKQSLEHSFMLVPVEHELVAFDSYDVDTDWGPARPTAIARSEWIDVPVDSTFLIAGTGSPHPPRERRAYIGAQANRDGYLRAVREEALDLEQLAVDTWLIARARSGNVQRAADGGKELTQLAEDSRNAWASASEAVYMATRRARRGRPVPSQYKGLVADAFDADVALSGPWES